MISVSAIALVLVLCVLQSAAQSVPFQSSSAKTRPGDCVAIPLQISAGYNVESILVHARPEVR